MIVPVMVISNLELTQQIYFEETNGAHAHYREPVPLKRRSKEILYLPNTINCTWSLRLGSGRSFLKNHTTIEYMNSSSLVTGFLKISVAGRLAL